MLNVRLTCPGRAVGRTWAEKSGAQAPSNALATWAKETYALDGKRWGPRHVTSKEAWSQDPLQNHPMTFLTQQIAARIEQQKPLGRLVFVCDHLRRDRLG